MRPVGLCVLLLAMHSDGKRASVPWPPGRVVQTTDQAAAPSPEASANAEADEERACRKRIEAFRRTAAPVELEPAPVERARLLAEVKATPVWFPEPLRFRSDDPVRQGLRRELEQSEVPGRVVARLLARYRHFPRFLRDVLLTDGYVYATTPQLGTALAEGLSLDDLFRDAEIVVQSGRTRTRARLGEDGQYLIADGAHAGEPARMVLFDRVWALGTEPGPARHLELESLRDELGFDELLLERASDDQVLAKARYGSRLVPTLIARHGASLSLGCELPGSGRGDVLAARARALRQRRVHDALVGVIEGEVEEALPFDEPRTELGQQDGKLRQEWRQAYAEGRARYEFNGDTYRVFDREGRPRVPQVCVDFVFDTLERLGGSWYAPHGSTRERRPGRVNFDSLGMENRRNVEQFLALAERRSDLFELRRVPPEERVPLARRDRFFATLFEHRDEYREGDVVVILGLRDDDKLHYHSFFVVESDPLTGMPTLVAGNSGRPRIRAWAVEMAPAPKRSPFARVRPRLEWLEEVGFGRVGQPGGHAPAPPGRAEP